MDEVKTILIENFTEIDYSKHEIRKVLENMRVVALELSQYNDKNGCYTDEQSMAEFGEIVNFEWALNYFIWYTNEEIASIVSESVEVTDLAKQLGVFEKHVQALYLLSTKQNYKDYFEKLIKDGDVNKALEDLR